MPSLQRAAYVRSIEHNLLRIYAEPPERNAMPPRLQTALERLQAKYTAQQKPDDSASGGTILSED